MRSVHRAWRRTSDAATEPVSLAEARAHLRMDDNNSDTAISALISAARQYAEEYTGRALVTQTWRLVLDSAPMADESIALPRPPLVSVTSVAYVDGAGDTQTWASSNYRVDADSEPARITLAHGATWPLVLDVSGAVTVTYVAGYGTATAVPGAIRQAILLLVGHWFMNREAVVVGTISKAVEFAVDALLGPYKLHGFD